MKGGKRGSVLCVFAEQAGERASDHQGHAAEGQTDGGQPVHAGLRQGMCVLHSGQSGVSRQNRGVRLCVLHRRQLGGAGQYGRVGILFINDLVAAVVVTATVGINVHDLGAGDQDIPAFHGGAVIGDVGGLIHLGHLAYRYRIGVLLGAVGVAEAAAVLVAGAVTGEGAGKQLAEAGVVARAGARGIGFTPLVLLGGVGILVGVAD